MRRRRIPFVVVGAAVPLVTVLVGLVTNQASAQKPWPVGLDFLRTYPWQSLGVLTAVLLGLTVWSARSAGIPPEIDLLRAADGLAAAVHRDWSYEAEWRKVYDPSPIPVRWVPADPDLVAGWSAVVRLATAGPGQPVVSGWAGSPARLAGADTDLAGVLRRVPTGRLVVLGDPGAGKTILLLRLVLDLLTRRSPGEPVPILLPLASWNPAEEDLPSWIVRWLTTDRAGLAGLAGAGSRVSLARALVEAGLILPVLDGLDEIPEGARGSAIARINDAMRPGQGLILAARTADYQSAVHPPGGAEVRLTGAPGIELCPLRASEVADYLRESAGGPAGAARWEPVIAAFAADWPPPVAQALTTPLMAALARAVYNPRPGEDLSAIPLRPAELLDLKVFPASPAIERHLFDQFIKASYRQHPDPLHPSRRYRWTAGQAERWLAFLARDLQYRQGGVTDLAWWKLPGAAPGHLAGLVVGLVAGSAAAVGYPFVGAGVGLTSGLLTALMVRSRLRSGAPGLTRGLAGGLLGGTIAAVIALAVLGPGVKDFRFGTVLAGGLGIGLAVAPMGRFAAGLAGGFAGDIALAFYQQAQAFQPVRAAVGDTGSHLINGLGVGLAALLAVELAGRVIPARGLRWSPGWFACGAAGGLVLGFSTWIQAGWEPGLAVGLTLTIGGGLLGAIGGTVAADVTEAADPGVVLRRDRVTFLAAWLGLGGALVLVGLASAFGPNASGQPSGFRPGLEIGLTNLAVIGLIFGCLQAAWGRFTVARWWLAISRCLPWRFMTFLHDAHANRGVLRQAGSVYQFRHIELQRHLARSSKSGSEVASRPPTLGPPGQGPMPPGSDRVPPGAEC